MLVSKETFDRAVILFQDRFGEHRMSQETANMWFHNLRGCDDEQFKKAFAVLLGEKDRVFGWQLVKDKIGLMFEKEDEQAVMDRKWKKEHETKDHSQYERIGVCINHLNDLRKQVKETELTAEVAKELFWEFTDSQNLFSYFKQAIFAPLLNERFSSIDQAEKELE